MVEPYKLIHPVTVDDRQVTEIPLRRGTLGDLIALEKGPKGESEQLLLLLSRLSGFEKQSLVAITADDIFGLTPVLGDLL
mgnify:CR=1 FL=1